MIELHSSFLTRQLADELLQHLLTLPFEQHYATFSGKEVAFPRLTLWCNDYGKGYFYSGQETPVFPWPQPLLGVREKIESFVGRSLPSALLNYYRNETDSVGWHRDNEKWFRSDPYIVSLSLGATREILLRHRETKESLSYDLAHGDLLIFTDDHVLEWEHTIPKAKTPTGPRINVTFRVFKEEDLR